MNSDRFTIPQVKMRVAANLSTMFKGVPLLERYGLAKKFGFKLVELPFGYSESAQALKKAADDCDLQHVLINAKIDSKIGGLACRNELRDKFNEYLDISLEYAQVLNCKIVHVMAGDGNPTTDEEIYVENLRSACRKMAKHDILCVIEPLNSHNFPNYFLRSYDQAKSIVNQLNEPNLKILFDVYHCQLICGQITHQLTSLAPWIGHIQVSQPPQRNEPSTEGEVNFDYFFNLLRKLKIDSYIGAEYFESTDNANWVRDYKLSF
ncbi:putative hydroxypyruvate isomerase [Aphelenchoides besseyi]|nr:putative hydroxypyruvate isomerase [Aphelenchoides besseyi]KAI6237377.1 putative hydroxypyruvate isomerase [Aphelenchoides besseyi]